MPFTRPNWNSLVQHDAAALAPGVRWVRESLCAIVLWGALLANSGLASEVVYPVADGTIADGGVFGVFDGVPDDSDWVFDESGYDGAITLATETPQSSIEHRVVWQYNLSAVSTTPPVSATLSFSLRGAPAFPMPDAVVHVYSFPPTLTEAPEQFDAQPATFLGSVTLAPFQPQTPFVLDVSTLVTDALNSGAGAVAFRFQINPSTPHDRNQAFFDALDEQRETKPTLVIDVAGIPGDVDGDGDVDLTDLAMLLSAFDTCLGDPGFIPGADANSNGCVDLADLALLLSNFSD